MTAAFPLIIHSNRTCAPAQMIAFAPLNPYIQFDQE
jgi:hypothetical protein